MENLPSDTRPFSATFTYGPGCEVKHTPSCMVDTFVCRHTPLLGFKLCICRHTYLLECMCLPTHPVGYTFFWSVDVCVDMLSPRVQMYVWTRTLTCSVHFYCRCIIYPSSSLRAYIWDGFNWWTGFD